MIKSQPLKAFKYFSKELAEWYGKEKERLQLDNRCKEVTEKRYYNLLRGFSPSGGHRLARRVTRRVVDIFKSKGKGLPHHPGLHLVFTVPKSISLEILEKVEGRWQIKDMKLYEAYQKAVHLALDGIQKENIFARCGRGGKQLQQADNVLAALFPEFENNRGEPHVHIHAVLFNLVYHGKWRAFSRREFWASQSKNNWEWSASRMFDYYMAKGAANLGHELRRNGRHAADLARWSRSEIERHSTRSKDIRERERELARTGLPTKTVRELAYVQTRKRGRKAPIRVKRPYLAPETDSEARDSARLMNEQKRRELELTP